MNRWLTGSVVALTVLAYLPGLSGPFVYDDIRQIQRNQALHDPFDIGTVLTSPMRPARPLQNLSFAVNWALSPDATWSFKVANLLLHLLNGWLLWRLLAHVLPHRRQVAGLAVALFLLHPLQTQSVAYVMGRISLMQAAMTLLILHLCVQRRASTPTILGLLAVAYMTKESTILIPALLLLYQLSLGEQSLRQALDRRMILIQLSVLAAVPWYVALSQVSIGNTVSFSLYPFATYCLSQFYYHLFYLYLFVNPSAQSIIHPHVPPTTLVYVLGVVGSVVYFGLVAFALARLRKQPLPAFFLLFFFLSLLPTNGPLQMANPFAEYRLYQSNIPLCLALAWGLDGALSLVAQPLVRRLAFGALLTVLAAFTASQAWLWSDGLRLYRYALASYPASQTLSTLVGSQLEQQGYLAAAESQYVHAAALIDFRGPSVVRPIFRLARLQARRGAHEEALETLNRVRASSFPMDRPPARYFELKLHVLERLQRSEELELVWRRAVRAYGAERFAEP